MHRGARASCCSPLACGGTDKPRTPASAAQHGLARPSAVACGPRAHAIGSPRQRAPLSGSSVPRSISRVALDPRRAQLQSTAQRSQRALAAVSGSCRVLHSPPLSSSRPRKPPTLALPPALPLSSPSLSHPPLLTLSHSFQAAARHARRPTVQPSSPRPSSRLPSTPAAPDAATPIGNANDRLAPFGCQRTCLPQPIPPRLARPAMSSSF